MFDIQYYSVVINIITVSWYAMRYPEELHNIILEGMIEGKKTTRHPWNSYIGEIKCDAKVKTFKELKEKARNRLEWRIGVVNQPSGWKKNRNNIYLYLLRVLF